MPNVPVGVHTTAQVILKLLIALDLDQELEITSVHSQIQLKVMFIFILL